MRKILYVLHDNSAHLNVVRDDYTDCVLSHRFLMQNVVTSTYLLVIDIDTRADGMIRSKKRVNWRDTDDQTFQESTEYRIFTRYEYII